MKKAAKIFNILDSDKDGVITREDIKKQIDSFYKRESDEITKKIDRIFNNIKVLGRDQVSFMEFLIAFYDPVQEGIA